MKQVFLSYSSRLQLSGNLVPKIASNYYLELQPVLEQFGLRYLKKIDHYDEIEQEVELEDKTIIKKKVHEIDGDIQLIIGFLGGSFTLITRKSSNEVITILFIDISRLCGKTEKDNRQLAKTLRNSLNSKFDYVEASFNCKKL